MACPEKTLIKYTPDIHARERGLFQRQGHVYVSCKCVCVGGGGASRNVPGSQRTHFFRLCSKENILNKQLLEFVRCKPQTLFSVCIVTNPTFV